MSYKQLLDEVFVISRIMKVEAGTLIILDITETESDNQRIKEQKSCFCYFIDGKQDKALILDMITIIIDYD